MNILPPPNSRQLGPLSSPAPPMAASDVLQAEAFAKLYPEQYYAKFVSQGVRPDGRPLGAARPTSVGLGAVSTADASALVKVGTSTALAGIKCEVFQTTDEAPDEGRVTVTVEMAPLCSAVTRPGRPSEAAQVRVWCLCSWHAKMFSLGCSACCVLLLAGCSTEVAAAQAAG